MAKIGNQGDGGGPKPTVFTDEQITQVEALASCLNVSQLADYFEVSESTFERIRQRQPEVMMAYKRGRAKAIAGVGGGLLQKAQDGDTASMIFYLKTQAGWREDKQEEARDIPPINITVKPSGTDNTAE